MRKPVDMTKFASSVTKKLNVSYGFNDPKIWVDTGNYILNYLISGDFKKGIPLSKVSMFAGASGSGKSLIVSGMLTKHAQDMGIIPVLFDSENALDEEWLKNFGIDTSPEKILRFQVSMINDVGKIMAEFIKDYRANYADLPHEEQPCFLFVIDSLGMLLTDTDVDQFTKGDMKGDMGRKPKQLNALVRNLVNQIADLNIGVVCTNHTYASQDMFDPDDKISGGCLIAGTKIITSDGVKSIEEMEIGDYVLSNDNNYHEVIQTWQYDKPTFTVELEDGQLFECSPEHKFAVVSGDSWEWREAQYLTDDDAILSFDQELK
jgi:RecA/RadA recombinase